MNRIRTLFLLALVATLLLPESADAQLFGRRRSQPTPPTPAAPAAPAKKTIAQTVAKSRLHQGLFPVYQDTVDGSTHIVVRADQLDTPFIYFSYTENGPVPANHFRGMYRDTKVIVFTRYFDRLEVQTRNTNYHFDPENAISRAADANISPATLLSEKIVAEETDSTGTRYLIKADGLFLSEALSQVKPPMFPGQNPMNTLVLGQLSRDKSRIASIRNYPENTDVVIDYVYDNPSPLNSGGGSVTDARSIHIRSQHSIIRMPENDYRPRFADPRVGFFTDEKTDLSDLSPTPYHDLITRWHLVKKDPAAAVSEPVNPIVFWIENTTPVEIRPSVEAGVLAWNKAFEAAGFRNAVQVRVQPDDADWDAGDIRYNVLRWTSSPVVPFGGYGPSFTNPLTGQILGADIMLEYSFLGGTLQEEEILAEARTSESDDHRFCSYSVHLMRNHRFAVSALEALDAPVGEMNRLRDEAVRMLILHEVGHTLGLSHNMKASQLHDPVAIHDRELTSRVGLTGSVMDYSTVNIPLDRSKQGLFYDITPGPYDVWAITFGYTTDEAALPGILARSTERELAFGNDADDMRSAGKAINPLVNVDDMSSDAIAYGIERANLANQLFDRLMAKAARPGESYQRLRNGFMVAFAHHRIQMGVISRYVGGVYTDRAFVGQTGATRPFVPVERDRQKQAMSALDSYLFAPDAFKAGGDLLAHLQTTRRGFNLFNGTEDPKIHDMVLASQRNVLNHIMHPVTTKRMTDARLYGNQYPVSEVFADLTNATFRADLGGNVNTFRQNLQIDYVNRLIAIVKNEGPVKYDTPTQSAALFQARNIESLLKAKTAGNLETRAHTAHVLHLIDAGLNR